MILILLSILAIVIANLYFLYKQIKKIEKENNRYIQQWESEKIAIENGRWGPFIRFGKEMLKLKNNPKTKAKYTPEELLNISLEEVKKLIIEQLPKAFDVKKKVTALDFPKSCSKHKYPAVDEKSPVLKSCPFL